MDGRSLRAICREPGMPGRATIFDWLKANADFRRQYALARQVQADLLAEEALEIADDTSRDFIDDKPNREAIARAKLRIDTRRWLLSHLAPKKYKAEEDGETEEDRELQELFDEIRSGRKK